MEVHRPPSPDFEKYGDFNPETIAAVLGTKARLSHFEILTNSQTLKEVRKYPVYAMDIVDPITLESIEIYLKPDIRTVGIVAHSQPIDLIIAMRQGVVPPIQLDTIPQGAFPTHTVELEGVDKVVVHRGITSVVLPISFISENDISITELNVYRNARFSFFSNLKKGEGYAIRLEELPRR